MPTQIYAKAEILLSFIMMDNMNVDLLNLNLITNMSFRIYI